MDENRSTGDSKRGGTGPQGSTANRGQGGQGGSESLYDQAQGALRDAADTASDVWDDAYEQGEHYYRAGTRAVGNVDGSAIGVAVVAGALGYALAWMIHGQQSHSSHRGSIPDYARTRTARDYRNDRSGQGPGGR